MEYFDHTISWEVFTACKSEVLCFLESKSFLSFSSSSFRQKKKLDRYTSRSALMFLWFLSYFPPGIERKSSFRLHPTRSGTETRLVDVIVTDVTVVLDNPWQRLELLIH